MTSSAAFRPLCYDMGDGVMAFSTTRHGGVGEGAYASFNINEYCGDTTEAISANRSILAAYLGISDDHILMPHQTHGVNTRIVDSELIGRTAEERRMLLDDVDAVMTDVPGVCVGVSTADCIPILLYDAEHRAVAAIHAGWRGTLARIVCKTIADMRMAYDTDPRSMKAVIGPGISLRNFEVGDEVYSAFEAAAFDMSTIAERQTRCSQDATGQPKAPVTKWHIDLPLANRQLLVHMGLAVENIHVAGICTYDSVGDFFSARRLGVKSGRIYTGILLRQ